VVSGGDLWVARIRHAFGAVDSSSSERLAVEVALAVPLVEGGRLDQDDEKDDEEDEEEEEEGSSRNGDVVGMVKAARHSLLDTAEPAPKRARTRQGTQQQTPSIADPRLRFTPAFLEALETADPTMEDGPSHGSLFGTIKRRVKKNFDPSPLHKIHE